MIFANQRTSGLRNRLRGITLAAAMVLALQAPDRAWGQWTGTSPITTMSNVGIGTATPAATFNVNGPIRIDATQTGWSEGLVINAPTDLGYGGIAFHNAARGGTLGGGTIKWLAYYNYAPELGTTGGGLAFAENNASTRLYLKPGGNVGIGTTSPNGKLHVANGLVFFDKDGITDTSNGQLTLEEATPAHTYQSRLSLGYASGGRYGFLQGIDPGVTTLPIALQPAGGNVGIGTIAPQYKLAVNGTIGAKEVIVTNTGWADYVFKPNYRLAPLAEVAAFIKENHHLPELPSEKEALEKGVGLGEMQVKLLAKIEELTLHVIRADEQNRELQARIAKLEAAAQAKK